MNKINNKTYFFQKVMIRNIDNILYINNKYKKNGFNIYLVENYLEIIYKDIIYNLFVIKKNNDYIWHLELNKSSLFETKIDNKRKSLEKIISSIIKQDNLYKSKENRKD